jgi:hypothetical protein
MCKIGVLPAQHSYFLHGIQRKAKYSLWNSQSKILVETIVAEKMSYLCLAGYTYESSFPTH